MRACIIIPMYNEERIVQQSVETVLQYLKDLPGEFRLLVVDDGSNDNTRPLLEECRNQYPEMLSLIFHQQNKGYGSALRSGISFALKNGFDYVLFMDSDLTNHPKYLKGFYEQMNANYDYIKANRYAHGSEVVGVPWGRRIIAFWGNKVARMFFGLPIHDLTNGFRAVKTSFFFRISLKENGFALIMEELYLCKSLVHSYAEVPYVLTSRRNGEGNTHFIYDIKTYFLYLKYALKSMFVRAPLSKTKKGKR